MSYQSPSEVPRKSTLAGGCRPREWHPGLSCVGRVDRSCRHQSGDWASGGVGECRGRRPESAAPGWH